MDIQDAIRLVVERENLAFEQMRDVMTLIMQGEATPAQIAGLLIGLRMKGETTDEIAAAASVMRALAVPVEVGTSPLIDTCGTGGDGIGTFNVSTAAAFVVAAAGGKIAKHGNRAASSSSGSADLLEAAGAAIELSADQVAQCIHRTGVGFMFAPAHHGATRHAVGPRRELGTRTLFNLLGPLTNPANADVQLMGVFDQQWVPQVAEVLSRLGVRRAMVVCADDGMDEISIHSETLTAELNNGTVTSATISPESFGFKRQSLSAIAVSNASDSLALVNSVFAGEPGPARDIVALNAGAAIYLADLANDMEEGVALALREIDDGKAKTHFSTFIETTQQLARGTS